MVTARRTLPERRVLLLDEQREAVGNHPQS
jgi:hypothetical protein